MIYDNDKRWVGTSYPSPYVISEQFETVAKAESKMNEGVESIISVREQIEKECIDFVKTTSDLVRGDTPPGHIEFTSDYEIRYTNPGLLGGYAVHGIVRDSGMINLEIPLGGSKIIYEYDRLGDGRCVNPRIKVTCTGNEYMVHDTTNAVLGIVMGDIID